MWISSLALETKFDVGLAVFSFAGCSRYLEISKDL
jgi:hypothetical protein